MIARGAVQNASIFSSKAPKTRDEMIQEYIKNVIQLESCPHAIAKNVILEMMSTVHPLSKSKQHPHFKAITNAKSYETMCSIFNLSTFYQDWAKQTQGVQHEFSEESETPPTKKPKLDSFSDLCDEDK